MSNQVQDAYIVAATRTPVGKARGVMRNVRPDDMLAHVLRAAADQVPSLDPKVIDDAIIGCAMPEAEQGMNVARMGVLLAGLPDSVSGLTINRFCSSGVQAVAAKINTKDGSRNDIIRRIVASLHRNIRYTGVEFGESSLIPQFPAEPARLR